MMTDMERDLAAALDDTQIDDKDDLEKDLENSMGGGEPEEETAKETDDTHTKEKPDEEDKDTTTEKDNGETPAAEENGDQEASKTKAPAGWTPSNREHWAGLPDELKAQISKREQEVNTVLQSSAQDRKTAGNFLKTAEPYKAIMEAEGTNDPIAAFKGLMETASTLKMGSQAQKAKKISDLIGHYGVDIGELDNLLSAGPEAPDKNSEFETLLSQRLAPMEKMIGDYQQREQQAQQKSDTGMQNEVEAFGEKNEFFSDVRMTMADAMDLASKQGRNMSLQEAYDFACNMTPEVKKVIATRAGQNDLGKKKAASSSLNYRKGSGGGKESPAGLEAQIAELWDGAPS